MIQKESRKALRTYRISLGPVPRSMKPQWKSQVVEVEDQMCKGWGLATLTEDKKDLLGAGDSSAAPQTRERFQLSGDHCV